MAALNISIKLVTFITPRLALDHVRKSRDLTTDELAR